jgi:magnesium-transporting ATPase (P-type)
MDLMVFLLDSLTPPPLSAVWYLDGDADNVPPEQSGAALFFTFVILYNSMVPLSLYVSMELVKLAQTIFIDSDVSIYDPINDVPAKARTTLHEELGQVPEGSRRPSNPPPPRNRSDTSSATRPGR